MNVRVSLLVLVAACFFRGADAAERPNVLLILVDDLKPAMGIYGDTTAQTPNLDALAQRGLRFENAYCNQAVCAPSRFTLMLGSHSTSTGLYGLGSQLREVLPNATTMPQFFAQHGYRTESLGKVFHIGHGNSGDPSSFQVPHFHDKVIEYVDPASTPGGELTREEAYFTNQQLGRIRELPRGAAFESPDVSDEAYADGRVAKETIRRLESAALRRKQAGTPFFIAAGFARPHLPFSAPKKYWDLYSPDELPMPAFEQLPNGAPRVAGKRGGEITNYFPYPDQGEPTTEVKRKLIHGYYAATSFVDAQIGKVIAALDRFELAENTVIVLWGDHGFHLGDLGIWTKHTNYEQANRIPLIFVAPGFTTAGSKTNQPAESVDVFPTLTEVCGLGAPDVAQPMDGVSLVPVFKDPAHRVRSHAYHAYPKQKLGRAIRTERYRLVEWKKLGTDESPEYELYDYETDPLETRNLAADHPQIVEELADMLATYPEAVSLKKSPRIASPKIKDQELELRLTVQQISEVPLSGVAVSHGGNRWGYAIRFVQGVAQLDVRLNGKLATVKADVPAQGKTAITATVTGDQISIALGDKKFAAPTSSLIRTEPVDPLVLGDDLQTPVGNYTTPHPFNGQVLSWEVKTNRVPRSN